MKLTIAAPVVGIGSLGAPLPAPGNSSKTISSCPRGSYRLVESRASMRIVFVEPACDNLDSMKALGDELRTDFAAESIVAVLIFDDMRAANMYDLMVDEPDSFSVKEDHFYDKCMIGSYHKNVNTGLHNLLIGLQGLDGPEVEINY